MSYTPTALFKKLSSQHGDATRPHSASQSSPESASPASSRVHAPNPVPRGHVQAHPPHLHTICVEPGELCIQRQLVMGIALCTAFTLYAADSGQASSRAVPRQISPTRDQRPHGQLPIALCSRLQRFSSDLFLVLSQWHRALNMPCLNVLDANTISAAAFKSAAAQRGWLQALARQKTTEMNAQSISPADVQVHASSQSPIYRR